MSDKQLVLEYLQSGVGLTCLCAWKLFHTNSMKDIVYKLRKEGYPVIDCWCRRGKKRFKKYFIGRSF